MRGAGEGEGVLSWWLVDSHGSRGEQRMLLQVLGAKADGSRAPAWERLGDEFFSLVPATPTSSLEKRRWLLHEHLEPMLFRELEQRGVATDSRGFSAQLIAWLEVVR